MSESASESASEKNEKHEKSGTDIVPRTRRLRALLPVVLVLAVIGGGLVYIGGTIGSADRTSPVVTAWADDADGGQSSKDPAGNLATGRASTELSKLLLPVPPAYALGPDIKSYGNDTELNSAQAIAFLKTDGMGVPGSNRLALDKQIDGLGVQGIAMRAYASALNDHIVETQIMRMKDRKRIRGLYEFQTKLVDKVLKAPRGPKIKDHRNASCFLLDPELSGDWEAVPEPQKIDRMICMAYEGDLMVNVMAHGTRPFAKTEITDLLKAQLDHIASPGESV